MINFNGTLTNSTNIELVNNRGFNYGDAIFETVKVFDSKVLFLEDHYFRLMASMRICRMEIAMNFTMEYFEEQILLVSNALNLTHARVRLTVYRNAAGKYYPEQNSTQFVAVAEPINEPMYLFSEKPFEVELFKDFFITKQLLSTLKTTNKMEVVLASIFAEENDYNTCLMLNNEKQVIEGVKGNLFMLKGNKLTTPPITDGCLNGVMRKQILAIAKKIEDLEVIEESISPFDLQKADELFLTNVISGIQPITKYRKKEFKTEFSGRLVNRLNALIRLN